MIIAKFVLVSRFLTVLSLLIIDFFNHKNFYEDYIIDEGPLSNSFLESGNKVINSRVVDLGNLDTVIEQSGVFRILLDQSVKSIYNSETQSIQQYFLVDVMQEGSVVSSVEKTYEDIKAFALALQYTLKGRGREAPKLEQTMTGQLLTTNDDFFRFENSGGSLLSISEQIENLTSFFEALGPRKDCQTPLFMDFFNLEGISSRQSYKPRQSLFNEESMPVSGAYQSYENKSVFGERGGQGSGGKSGGGFQDSLRKKKTSIGNYSSSIKEDRNTPRSRRVTNFKNQNWIHFQDDRTEKYCNFFFVRYLTSMKDKENKKVVYSFLISSVLHPELEYDIEKQDSQFTKLASSLSKDLQAVLPSLPSKKLLPTKESQERRGELLKEWLMDCLNTKLYHSRGLFVFIELPSIYLLKYLGYQPFSALSEKIEFQITILSNDLEKGDSSEDNFQVYNILVEAFELGIKTKIFGYAIKRRFSEFYSLQRSLKKVFKNYKKDLPELPSKLTNPFAKNGVESRRRKLQDYLRNLIQFPTILDLLRFRKFLEVEPSHFSQYRMGLSYSQNEMGGIY